MHFHLISLLLLFPCISSAATAFTGESSNLPFVIHGRLSAYNGNPTLRIWIIGSHRILGVASEEGKESEAIPKTLGDVLNNGEDWFTREFYGDFTVEPLQPDIKGRMRPIRILAVKNLVVK